MEKRERRETEEQEGIKEPKHQIASIVKSWRASGQNITDGGFPYYLISSSSCFSVSLESFYSITSCYLSIPCFLDHFILFFF